jgi:hypothetical protein
MAEPEPETESEPEAESDEVPADGVGATCHECRWWSALERAGAIAPPVDAEFEVRCKARGLDPEKNQHLASWGRCRGRAPRGQGPIEWPMTPALEPMCGAFSPRVR